MSQLRIAEESKLCNRTVDNLITAIKAKFPINGIPEDVAKAARELDEVKTNMLDAAVKLRNALRRSDKESKKSNGNDAWSEVFETGIW